MNLRGKKKDSLNIADLINYKAETVLGSLIRDEAKFHRTVETIVMQDGQPWFQSFIDTHKLSEKILATKTIQDVQKLQLPPADPRLYKTIAEAVDAKASDMNMTEKILAYNAICTSCINGLREYVQGLVTNQFHMLQSQSKIITSPGLVGADGQPIK